MTSSVEGFSIPNVGLAEHEDMSEDCSRKSLSSRSLQDTNVSSDPFILLPALISEAEELAKYLKALSMKADGMSQQQKHELINYCRKLRKTFDTIRHNVDEFADGRKHGTADIEDDQRDTSKEDSKIPESPSSSELSWNVEESFLEIEYDPESAANKYLNTESEESMLKKQVDRLVNILITISSPSDDDGVRQIMDSDSDFDIQETENSSDEVTFTKPNVADSLQLPTLWEMDEPTALTPQKGSDSQTVRPKARPWTRSRPYNPESYDIGLRNIDNTCYVNATLQALFALPDFTDDLVKALEGAEKKSHFAFLLAKMITARKEGLPNAVDKLNEDLVNSLSELSEDYEVRRQQDASELLTRLISHLKWASPDGHLNPVASHFEYEMIEGFHCTACGKKKKRAQKHTSICLPMPKDSRTLEQCLEDYMAEEERELACSSCKATTSKFSSKFRTLPKILIFTVKRYSNEGKLAIHIKPPQVLDIRPFLEKPESQLPSEYTLAAQIVHIGHCKDSGHYVSHVYCEDGFWRLYNDDKSVKKISIEEEIESGDPAYVYFYVHQSRFQD